MMRIIGLSNSLAQEPPPMSESYQIVPPPGSSAPLDPKRIADLLAKDGQLILPLLDLLENAQCALDDVIDVMGRATIEAVLRMSAEAIAGPRQQGKKSDRDIVYHGTQKGRIALKERELVVEKPRLRRRHPQEGESAEVEIPAYEAMRDNS
jgi:putative transposase